MNGDEVKLDRPNGWSMGLGQTLARYANLTSVALVSVLFAASFWNLQRAFFEQATEDRLLCRQQIVQMQRAIDAQTELLREVKALLQRWENKQ